MRLKGFDDFMSDYIPKIIKQLIDKRADLNRVTRMYNEATITRQLRKGYAKVNGDIM